MGRRKKGKPVTGWLVVDKPEGISSNAVVGKARWAFEAQKVGHAGTLDPMATGVLPLAFGEATKTLPFLVDAAKSYRFTITWGASTDTLDAEGVVTATSDVRPTGSEVEAMLPNFLGAIDQMPPAYSALKVDGKRAYDLARAGEKVALKARPVRIDALVLEAVDAGSATLRVDCGKGTYVRALARDIAAALGAEGHVSLLRRLKVGKFTEKGAISFDILDSFRHKDGADAALIPIATALDDIPAVAVSEGEAQKLQQGQPLAEPLDVSDLTLATAPTGPLLATLDGVAVALVETGDTLGKTGFRPVRVFNQATL